MSPVHAAGDIFLRHYTKAVKGTFRGSREWASKTRAGWNVSGTWKALGGYPIR